MNILLGTEPLYHAYIPPFLKARLLNWQTHATVALFGRRKLRWRTRQELLLKVWKKASSLSCVIQIPNRIKWNIVARGTSSSFHPVIWQRRLCALLFAISLFSSKQNLPCCLSPCLVLLSALTVPSYKTALLRHVSSEAQQLQLVSVSHKADLLNPTLKHESQELLQKLSRDEREEISQDWR